MPLLGFRVEGFTASGLLEAFKACKSKIVKEQGAREQGREEEREIGRARERGREREREREKERERERERARERERERERERKRAGLQIGTGTCKAALVPARVAEFCGDEFRGSGLQLLLSHSRTGSAFELKGSRPQPLSPQTNRKS